MGRREIPLSVKITVIRQYLEGLSREQIAQNNNISTGSVSNIVYESEEDIPFIYLLREVAVKLRNENIDVKDFASAFRLKKILDRLELTEGKIESLLEGVSEFCFRKDLDTIYFIKEMDKIISFTKKMHVPMDKLIPFLVDKGTELNLLKERIIEAKKEYGSWLLKNNMAEKVIGDYNKHKPFATTISRLEKELEIVKKENAILEKKLKNKGIR